MPINPDAVIELFTVPEVADMLRVCDETVRRLQHGRRIPFHKVGGRVRFLKSDIVEYIDKQRVEKIGS